MNSSISSFKKITRVLLPIVFMFCFLLITSEALKHFLYKDTWLYTRNKIYESKKNEIDTLVFGDSHDEGVLQNVAGVFNFASAGQNYFQSYYRFKSLDTSNIKNVIIPLDLNSLTSSTFMYRRYHDYWYKYIDHIELALISKDYMDVFCGYLSGLLFPYTGNYMYFLHTITGRKAAVRKKNDERRLSIHQKKFNERDDSLVDLAQKRVQEIFSEGVYREFLDIYCRKLIDLATKRGIKVTILLLPKTKYFKDAVVKFYDIDTFYEKRKALMVDYPGLRYVDLESAIPDDGKYFRDSDHLNNNGNALANTVLLTSLNRIQ